MGDQVTSLARLNTVDGATPSPTLVTTGLGPGKTECFLYPILDHCARMWAEGRHGIKALILYPMNSLATDQAGRIAETIAADARLAGVTAGLYVGNQGSNSRMNAESIIDRREILRADPPDILLTNYKMLDFLLLRHEDGDLWATNNPDTLQYVVLDEFHTYDGAQGTDVAMLLRRLGATLSMAEADLPLGSATPVATSATLGSGEGAAVALRGFAAKVFGASFEADAVIGETRLTVEEACGAIIDYRYPIPDPVDVMDLTDIDDVAAAFLAIDGADDLTDGDDPAGLAGGTGTTTDGHPAVGPHNGDATPIETDPRVLRGNELLSHPLTRAVLSAVGTRSRSWADAVADIVTFAPNWGRATMMGQSGDVERALAQYLRLLSEAKRVQGGRIRPLFSIQIQLWIREVTRLLRSVSNEPTFRWRDSAAATEEDDTERLIAGAELPAIYCRRCGMSGWMALASEAGDSFTVNPSTIGTASLNRSPLIRPMMAAHPDDTEVQWYSPGQRRLAEDADDRVPVLTSPLEDDAKKSRCPGCGERDAVRFLGLAVASLASVSINTLFASPNLESHERKLLAFTDSVQDASHRAGFFSGRTHRINLRSVMARLIREAGELSLSDLGDLLLADATTARDVFGLVPPDLVRHHQIRTLWTDSPAPDAAELLTLRLRFEADLEFGSRTRVGRTLELSRASAAEVRLDDADGFAGLVAEEAERISGQRPAPGATTLYLQGLLERLRLRGGLIDDLLEPYVTSGGKQWFIWGGRPDGLPPFTPGQGRPTFFTTATSGDFDSLTSPVGGPPTWLVDWARRSLDLEPAHGRELNIFTFHLLARDSEAVVARRAGSNTVYGLDRRSVILTDIVDESDLIEDDAGTDPGAAGQAGALDPGPTPSQLQCTICGHVHVAPSTSFETWDGAPCLRYRCVGRFRALNPRASEYYRHLYRRGDTHRVVAAEHTGLLKGAPREELERAFKAGTAPDAPNVLTATPTLEMGIDIGDLSAVMLTSVPRRPASYIQRVGRAGRSSGNSLVTTFVRTDNHGLYYLAEPDAMLAGDVRPPDSYLDAVETLQRQYVAYLMDRVADNTIDAPPLPRQIGALMRTGLDEGGFLEALLQASTLDTNHVARFVALFGQHLNSTSVQRLTEFAASGIGPFIKGAAATWDETTEDLGRRRRRLADAIERLDEQGAGSEREEIELSGLRGQRAAIIGLLRRHRNEYTLSALERLGVLPNYTLIGDPITLTATMWSRDEDGRFETEIVTYQRSGRYGIRELAPGSSFYAGGHRHYIDALEIGTAQEPLYEAWRLCPDCGYAVIEAEGEAPTACTRCGGHAIADTGARHLMLRLRAALASGSEEGARVFDETDERQRTPFDLVTAIDVEPEDISGAWTLAERAFGAELSGRTHIRTINLGRVEDSGESAPIAGGSHHVARFKVCTQCGAVANVRDDRDGANPEQLHQGWCKVRSGAAVAQWEEILLFHELTTEAIRMLLPVSMFEIGERLASFTGALLLGMREDFGGDPDHLQVEISDAPNRGGLGRRQFLVLFDSVPGGTGYLARMADPARMAAILEAARSVIARCPCIGEGRSACHRCLLGVVDRNAYDLVSRELALEILDDLLEAWEPEPIPSVANIDIGLVEESELERRFKIALRAWAENHPSDNVSFRAVPGIGRYGAFELRLEHDGVGTRYRIDEQAGLSNISTVPDYLITRMDDRSPDVAVYLDGYQFHASHQHNNIADDAAKRRAVRESGRIVWNLVWEDVDAFHKAAQADPPRPAPHRALLKGRPRSGAQTVQHAHNGVLDVDALNQNPMTLLLDYLARPDAEQWRRVALSAIAGLASSGEAPIAVSGPGLDEGIRAALAGRLPLVAADGAEIAAQARRYVTSNDLPLALFLDVRDGRANQERWTVVAALDDSLRGDEAVHRRRWRDWLGWANVLPFVTSPGRDVVIAATSASDDAHLDDLLVIDTAGGNGADATGAPSSVVLTEVMEEELELIMDDEVKELVEEVLRSAGPDFVAGHEVNGEPLEAAWPDHKVAVLPSSDGAGFLPHGWDARPVDEWTVEEVLDVLEERQSN